MSRSFDFVVATVVSLVAFAWHRMAVEFFDPNSALFEAAADASNLGGQSLATFWYDLSVLWIPLIAVGGIWLFAVVREWRRQAITGLQQPAR